LGEKEVTEKNTRTSLRPWRISSLTKRHS
jgi:hypothetical protein